METFAKYLAVLFELEQLRNEHNNREMFLRAQQTWEEVQSVPEDQQDEVFHAMVTSLMAFAGVSGMKLGRLEEALRYCNIGLEAAQQYADNGYGLARAYNNRGLVYHEMGKFIEASADYEKALAITEASDEDRIIALRPLILGNLAQLKIWRGQEEEGYSDLIKASADPSALFGMINTSVHEANQYNNLGFSAMRNDQLEDAEKYFHSALAVPGIDEETRGIVYCNLGEVYRRQGQLPQAAEYFEKAADLHERSEGLKEPLAMDLYNLGVVYRLMGKRDQALSAFKKAWDVIRAQSPHSWVALQILINLGQERFIRNDYRRARAAFKRGMELYEEIRPAVAIREEGHARYLQTYRGLSEMAMYLALHEGWRDQLLHLIERAKARFWKERLAASHSGSEDSEIAETFIRSAAEIRDLTGYNGLALNFFVGINAVFVSYCHNQALGGYRIDMGQEKLAMMVTAFRNDVMSSSRRAGQGAVGQQLADLLFEKLSLTEAPVRHIHIFPDGPLWSLPFEALPAPAVIKEKQNIEWVYELAPVSYSPSVTLLKDLRNIVNRRQSGSEEQLLLVSVKDHEGEFNQLEGAQEETKQIIRQLSEGTKYSLLENEQATKAAFLAHLETASHVHIASHAVADQDSARPYILFSGDQEEDRKLWMDELDQLNIPAELVFLSACSTQVGKFSVGEGLMSLARSFLWAGSQCVIATQWPVHDDKAKVFVGGFYAALFSGLSVAQALQTCRKAYIEQGGDIRTWAAFQTYGDADSWDDRYSLAHIDTSKIFS